jgi:hypothetical protein
VSAMLWVHKWETIAQDDNACTVDRIQWATITQRCECGAVRNGSKQWDTFWEREPSYFYDYNDACTMAHNTKPTRRRRG